MGAGAVPPLIFSRVTPSTFTFPFFGRTFVTFPSMLRNSPLTILTESPTLGLTLLLLNFARRSSERGEPNFKIHTSSSDDDGGEVGNPRPSFGRLTRDGTLDVRPLQLALRRHYDRRVVLEGDPEAADPAYRILLSHY